MKFFISYNHSDKKMALEISEICESKGIPCFLDEKDIMVAEDINESVFRNLSESTHLAVIISPGSLKSNWVPYEIGIAKGRGLSIVPILQHPSIDVPSFINNIRYCKTVDDFRLFIEQSGNLLVDLTIAACEMSSNDNRSFKIDFHDVTDEMAAQEPIFPAIMIKIRNTSRREIHLQQPYISFRKPQSGIIFDKGIEAIGPLVSPDEKPRVLSPGETTSYYIFHPGYVAPKLSTMNGIISAFFTENIDSITIESTDNRKRTVKIENIQNIKDIKNYYKVRFPDFGHNLEGQRLPN